MFHHKGMITIDASVSASEDDVIAAALDAGADDVRTMDGG